jgi:hypothetical protein
MTAGLSYPSAELAREGRDFEDEIGKMAADYGVTPDEMRRRLLDVTLPAKAAPAAPPDEFAQAVTAWLAAGGPRA